ncbi:MAG: T9SS type A sorting domain-containing protein [Saprospiraceae bacterium]
MKIKLLLLNLLFLFILAAPAYTQSCTYRLELYDAFGDGWNGASVRITIADSTYNFTLDRVNDNGFFRAFRVTVMDGDTATLVFNSGSFDGEVSFAIFNPENIRLYAAGPRPLAGIPLTAVLECPTCLVPDPNTVKILDVRAFTTSISWKAPQPGSRYLIEYGLKGFMPGNGLFASTQDTTIVLRNLLENTDYDFYVSSICAGSDTSRSVGPYAFKTLWARNVGVVAITTPETQCGLGANEVVSVTLKNFGGNPQSLIPFKYSINGRPVNIPMPQDGLFTGVLGKDSTFTIEFDTRFDFSNPGEYLIEAWTELSRDGDRSNDTTRVKVVSIPIINTYPYFEDFEEWSGGWTVADTSRNSSWEYGQPNKAAINSAASGTNVWITSLDTVYNNNETSYLISPCLNFSALTQDPRISFSMNLITEECCDEAWLEVSLDGGDTWKKVLADSTALNWYNDTTNVWWDGNGGVDGWRTVSTTLTGTKGLADVRLRFVFSSDFSTAREGLAIDNIFISEPLARDLATLSAIRTSTDICGSTTDRLRLSLSNFGTTAATGFNVGYAINGATPVIENVGNLSIPAGGQANYTFNTPFNSTLSGTYEIVVWVAGNGELFPLNDTITYRFNTALPVPFAEDFERNRIPTGWQTDAGTDVTTGHSNRSVVLADNLSTADRRMEVVTPPIGAIAMGDSLTFQYRIVNFSGNGTVATTLGARDSIAVQISTDCGQNYKTAYVINSQNHRPDTALQRIVVYLNEYAGSAIRVRFLAGWGAGDYWIDLDNINIIRCPASLGLTTQVENESIRGASDGQAIVSAALGTQPYTYRWSNGTADKINPKLPAGEYTVTVTDRFGCSDVANVTIGLTTSLEDIATFSQVKLAPNPTSGQTVLHVELRAAGDVHIQIFNTSGKLIYQTLERNASVLNVPLDLNHQPAGMYIVRLQAGNQIRSEKLIKYR